MKITYWNYHPKKEKRVVNNCEKLGSTDLIGPKRPGQSELFRKEPHTIFQSEKEFLIVSNQDIINIED